MTFSKTWTEETTPIRKDRDGDGTAESYPLYREVVFYIDSKQYEVTIDKWYSYDKQSGQMQEHISGGWGDGRWIPLPSSGTTVPMRRSAILRSVSIMM